MYKRGEQADGFDINETSRDEIVLNQPSSDMSSVLNASMPGIDWNQMLSTDAFRDSEIQPLLTALVPAAVNKLGNLDRNNQEALALRVSLTTIAEIISELNQC